MTDATAYTRNQQLNIAMAINNFWKLPVASVNSHNEIYSSLIYGVPREARKRDYRHSSIIWVYRNERNRWMVRKE